jgi:acyl carrier protein
MVELEGEFNTPVIEAYGMTEAAHQIASNPLPPRQRKAGSVGVAAGPEVAILDQAGNVLPPGQAGEVAIRGANVTSGYENNPAANRSAFWNGWLRTGDQGFLDGDGYLFLTGRLKELINRGGEKIAPREIDDVLLGHPAVAQAVTFAIPDTRLGEEVAAAVVLHGHTAVTARELREFVARRLADFKVPRRVLFVEAIPKGPTGKVQRLRLAEQLGLTAPQQGEPGEKAEFVAPRTPLEEELSTLWIEVLGIASVGVNDNFFDLGGDSILATQVLARICAAMQVELSMTGFFETPTVAGLAVAVTQKQAEKIAQEDMADLLAELEGLADDDAQRLLAGET